MKKIEKMTTKDWCSLYATMNMLLKQKIITFDLNKSYVGFHADETMTYLEKQNVNLQHQLKEKAKIIDEAIEVLKKYIVFSSKDRQEYNEIIVRKTLEILERGKNGVVN